MGLIAGLLLGEAVAKFALQLGLNYAVLYLLAYLVPIAVFTFWLAPMESRLIWLPALGKPVDDGHERWTMTLNPLPLPPFTFCAALGIVIGVSHHTAAPVTHYLANLVQHLL